MQTEAYLIVLFLIASASFFGVMWLVRASSRYRGTKIVPCPETGRPTAVEVDAIHSALTSAVGRPDIRLKNCRRWPLPNQCGQECLISLDVAPGECLVSGVLMRWYRGKTCCFCSEPFEELHWTDHQPGLLSPDGLLVKWSEVSIEDSSMVMDTHLPVCWNCYIAQTFVRDHPDLVVYRPWRYDIPEDADGLSASRHL